MDAAKVIRVDAGRGGGGDGDGRRCRGPPCLRELEARMRVGRKQKAAWACLLSGRDRPGTEAKTRLPLGEGQCGLAA